MNRHFSRVISWILCLALLAGTLPAGILAAPAEKADDGLILHYDFTSLAEGSTVADVSGGGHDGTVRTVSGVAENIETDTALIEGGTREVTAIHIQGGSPDDGGYYVELPAGVLNGLESLTVSCWVNLDQNVGYARIWNFNDSTKTAYMYVMESGWNDGHKGYTAGITTTGWWAEDGPDTGTPLAANVWKLTTLTYDGTTQTMRLYEDGKPVGEPAAVTVPLSALAGTDENWIGRGPSWDGMLAGKVADFRIYNYAMNETQVRKLYDPNAGDADKSVLYRTISAATSVIASAVTSEDGTDVSPSQKWVTPAVKKALQDVIDQAKLVADDDSADQARIDQTVADLEAAMAAFEEAKQAGKKEISKELVLAYNFESLKTGTIVDDISGNGKAGEVMPRGSGVQTAEVSILGKPQTAIVLNGGAPEAGHNYVEMPVGVLNGLDSLTVSCWVYVKRTSGYARIWDMGSDTTSYIYLLDNGWNEGHVGYCAALTNRGWSNEKGPQKGSSLETGKWILTTVTFDGDTRTMSLYEDGVLIDSQKTDADLSVLSGSTQNWIGYGQFKNDLLNGMIADFRIYNYAMTADEAAALFAISDEERVERDTAWLSLGDTSALTENLALPTKGLAASTITWQTGDAGVITAEGVITRPQPGEPNASAELTAAISSGEERRTKSFTVTVLALPTDLERVEHDTAAIDLGSLDAVAEDLTLPTRGELECAITWESSDPAVISETGKVDRPIGQPVQVTLTATVTYGAESKQRTFTATVIPQYEKLDIVKAQAVNVTTTEGTVPSLPALVKVTFEDGSTGMVKAVWPVGAKGSDYTVGTVDITGRLVDSNVTVTAHVTVAAEAQATPAASAALFDLSDISLDGSDSIYAQNMGRDMEYLKIMDADRMLYNFRATFGQDTKGAQALPGWDAPDCLLRGHSTGHFMSALAQAYASTGDGEYKEKLDYMIAEMRSLQLLSQGEAHSFVTACSPSNAAQSKWSTDPTTWGKGYIGAYSPDQFALLEQYTPYATIWAPYYTMHKLLAGFLDSYIYAGNETGLEIARDLGLWVYDRLSGCTTAEQRTNMWAMYIAGEYGGMNESLARLYEITEDARFLETAKMFDNTAFFDGLAVNEDTIQNRHANQHIPQIVGAVHEYAASGDSKYYHVAQHFWELATARYAYSIGGVGTGEMFKSPYAQGANILGNTGRGENCETCAAYNMLKLTRGLYVYDPDNAAYMDYYERTLLNQIAASQSHDTNRWMHNGVTYMLPIDPGQQRDFDSDYGGFTCCNGTGMENHVIYQAAAYAKAADTIYVNLYMPTTVTWAEKQVTLKQETAFPAEDVTLTVTGEAEFTMKLRVPYWATAGFVVKVNGETVCTAPETSTYVAITRSWKSGDTVTIHMPYTLYLDKTPDRVDGAAVASLMYGPLVMVARDDRSTYVPMNWYTLSMTDTNLGSTVGIREPAGTGKTPHLTVDGLDFFPMYDAYNYRYHAYVKLMEPKSVLNTQWLEAVIAEAEAARESDYAPADWAAIQAALTGAKALLNKENVTQEELYDAQVALAAALGHGWDAGTVTKAPTCTEAGEMTYRCKLAGCAETRVETLPALGHEYKNGVCTRCGAKDPNYVEPAMETIDFTDPAEASKFEIVNNTNNIAIAEGVGLTLTTTRPAFEPCNGQNTGDNATNPEEVVEIPVSGDWTATLTVDFSTGSARNGYYQFFGFYASMGDDYRNMAGIRGGDGAMQNFLRVDGEITADTDGVKSTPGFNTSGAAYYLRLVKEGTTYTCLRSDDGETFTEMFKYEDTGIEADKIVIDAYTGMTAGYQFTLKSLRFGTGSTACEHANTEIRDAREATCGAEGYTGDTWCTDCGKKVAAGEKIPATGEHTWNNGEVTTAPTCVGTGVKTYTCTVCGQTRTEEVPATGKHEWGEDGKCAVCRAEKPVVTGIDFTDPADASKFTVEGSTGIQIVEGVGLTLVSTTTGPEPAKQEQPEELSDAVLVPVSGDWTATLEFDFDANSSRGYYEFFGFYAYQDNNNMAGIRGGDSAMQDFLRVDGTITEETMNSEPGLPANVTHWLRLAKAGDTLACYASTDGEFGEPIFTLDISGIDAEYILIDAYSGMATGYTYTLKALTFEGETETCKHTHTQIRYAREATCTVAGYTGDTWCADCGKQIKKGQTVAALGHKWDAGKVTKQATCTETGTRTYTCSACNQTRTETVAALGHRWDEGTVTTPATCAAAGEEVYTCTVCKQTRTEILPALAHVWGEWIVTREPTTTEEGEKTSTCAICGRTRTEKLDPLPPQFVDVPRNAFYYESVYWAVSNKITTGTDATHFSPNQKCTRAQAVVFLYRTAGSPQVDEGIENPFVDVKPEDYFYNAVLWAVSSGITNGKDRTHFAPNEKLTRAHFVTFLWRATGCVEVEEAADFTDVPADQFYTKAVAWAVAKGITSGTSATTFSPNDLCSRGHVVTFLTRAYK